MSRIETIDTSSARQPETPGHGISFGEAVASGHGSRPELRRSRRPDCRDAPDHRRGETLDRRHALPARAELLHAPAGTGGTAARHLYRLASAQDEGALLPHPVRAAGRAGDHGAELDLCDSAMSAPFRPCSSAEGRRAGDRARSRHPHWPTPLKNNVLIGLAAIAFIALTVFRAPFPCGFGAGLIGYIGGRAGWKAFLAGGSAMRSRARK